jgi:hypothetical protein
MTPDELAARGLRVKELVWIDNNPFTYSEGHAYEIRQSTKGVFQTIGHFPQTYKNISNSMALAKAAANADHAAHVCPHERNTT